MIETIKRFEQKKFQIDGGTGSIGKSLIDASSFLLSNKFHEVIKSINIPNIRYLDEKISFLHLESINGPFLDPKRWISFSQNLVYWKVTLIKAASPSSLWNLSPFVAHLPFVCLYATIMYDGAILCWNFKINTMIDSQCKVSADKYMSKRTRLLELFIVRNSSVNKSIEHILTSSRISSKVWNGTSTLDWRIASHSLRHNFQLMYSMCVCVCAWVDKAVKLDEKSIWFVSVLIAINFKEKHAKLAQKIFSTSHKMNWKTILRSSLFMCNAFCTKRDARTLTHKPTMCERELSSGERASRSTWMCAVCFTLPSEYRYT